MGTVGLSDALYMCTYNVTNSSLLSRVAIWIHCVSEFGGLVAVTYPTPNCVQQHQSESLQLRSRRLLVLPSSSGDQPLTRRAEGGRVTLSLPSFLLSYLEENGECPVKGSCRPPIGPTGSTAAVCVC